MLCRLCISPVFQLFKQYGLQLFPSTGSVLSLKQEEVTMPLREKGKTNAWPKPCETLGGFKETFNSLWWFVIFFFKRSTFLSGLNKQRPLGFLHSCSVSFPVGGVIVWATVSSFCISRASLGAQRVKRLAAIQETGVRSLGREDPLEKEMATHSSTLAWKIPDQEEPGGLQSMGLQGLGHDWGTSLSFSFTFYTSRASSSHLILFSGTQWEESCLSEMWAQGMWLQIL